MENTKELIELANSKILSYSGIYVAQSQHQTLTEHLQKQAALRGISAMDFVRSLVPHTADFDAVINLVTVNETYFFREEKQFDFLKEVVFPKFMGKNLVLWTCCCSTGEEPISLLALALSMNVNLTIYASDIDDNALATLKRGRYSLYSLRGDGRKYHKLLEPYSTITENEIVFRQDFINRIHAFKFNLIQGETSQLPFVDNVDVLFMRNVFIYFDKETRCAVTAKLSQRIKKNGYLFFSMNEIGSIDNTVIPQEFNKTNYGAVYYFVKDFQKEKTAASKSLSPTDTHLQAKLHAQKKEKLRREVEKVKIQKFVEEKKTLEPAKAESAGAGAGKVPGFDAKSIYENVCMEINRGNFDQARNLAREISGKDTKKYSFFMQGYVEYHADNRAAAETFFASAESISPDFWPAFFYHGMVLRDMGRNENAVGCFSKCKSLLSDFGKKGGSASVPYDFTLDSFSPSYIYSLCETFSVGGGL